jgi:hypothetical protein
MVPVTWQRTGRSGLLAAVRMGAGARGCFCPGAVTNHGSVGVDIVAALLTHE